MAGAGPHSSQRHRGTAARPPSGGGDGWASANSTRPSEGWDRERGQALVFRRPESQRCPDLESRSQSPRHSLRLFSHPRRNSSSVTCAGSFNTSLLNVPDQCWPLGTWRGAGRGPALGGRLGWGDEQVCKDGVQRNKLSHRGSRMAEGRCSVGGRREVLEQGQLTKGSPGVGGTVRV